MSKKLNQRWVGFLAGLVGPWMGALIFYAIMFNHKTLNSFALMIINKPSTHASLLSVSLVFNLIFFFIAMRKDWYQAAQGVISAVFLYAAFVVYFKYFA